MSVRGIKAKNTNVHDILKEDYKSQSPINPNDVVFALDIGTRSVVGVIGIQQKDSFEIIDAEIMEHRSRAMRDGQIHDIAQVAEVVEIVKEKLESRMGFELHNISIAAAGRSLKTSSAKVERRIDEKIIISKELINNLELEGIQMAYAKLQEEKDEDLSDYYCVGHSVVNYYLNGYEISNLLDHKGNEIGAVVLATFLPKTVVDSLYAVMEKVNLKVTSLTLEPIAAINVSIPDEIRMLNIALIDIGAGTSDIAITKNGSIISYDMCSVAGDEITEKIASKYLLDFNTAEKVKLQLNEKKIIEFEDIMGIKFKIKPEDIIALIEPAIDDLAQEIAEKVIVNNGKSPNAVFCIGGASQTPMLIENLAKKLEIPVERVGIRDTRILKNIKILNNRFNGPDAITPVGIAITGLNKRGNDFIQVKINNKKISLYNTERVVVGDALVATGFTPEQLIPRRGKAVTFLLNGIKREVKGGYGNPAEIYINDLPASIDTPITNGDKIRVIPSEQGQDAKPYVKDFADNIDKKEIMFNNSQLNITTKILLNEKPTSLEQLIKENDNLLIEKIESLEDLINICEIDLKNFDVNVNYTNQDKSYIIKNGDVISTVLKKVSKDENKTQDQYNSEILNDKLHTAINVYVNGESVNLDGKSDYIFVDIFNYINMNTNEAKEGFELKLNGKIASYTDIIRNGDKIEINAR